MMRPLLFVSTVLFPFLLWAEDGLRWKNGDVLRGSLRAATPATIIWESPILSGPVELKRDVLEEFFSEKLQGPDDSPYLVVARDGSRLFGKVTKADSTHVVLESPSFDPIRIKRSHIKRVRLMRSESLLWAGPYGKSGWQTDDGEALREDFRWADEDNGGGLLFLQMSKAAGLDLDLPEQFEVRFTVEAPTAPEFALSVYSRGRALRFETWNQTVVLRPGMTRFQQVQEVANKERSLTLRLFWNVKTNRGLVCTDAGKILARFDRVDPLPDAPSDRIRIQGRCPELKLRTLEVWKWDGSEPESTRDLGDFVFENPEPGIKPSGLPVELANTGRFFGTLVESDASMASYQVGFSEDLFRLKNSVVRRLRFSPKEKQIEANPNLARLHLGEESIGGKWLPSGTKELLWQLEGAENPAEILTKQQEEVKVILPERRKIGLPDSLDMAYLTSGEIVPGEFQSFDGETQSFQFGNSWFEESDIDEDSLQGVFFKTRSLSADPGDPRWVKLGEGKVETKDGKITLHTDGVLGHPQILWTGRFSFDLPNTTVLAPNLKVRLFCDGLDTESRSTTLSFRHYRNSFQVTGLNRSGRTYINKAFRTQGPGPQTVELTWDDEFLRVRVGKEELEIPVDSVSGRSGFGLVFESLGRSGNKPVVIENLFSGENFAVTSIPYISPEALESVLIVPRSLKDQTPRHALLGNNQDVLRGILEDFDGERFLMNSGTLSTEIPLERVAGIVCLPVPPPSEPTSEGMWVLLRSGARFFLDEPVFGQELVTGHSTLLGQCRIPRNQIGSLHSGQPPKNPSADYLATFQLKEAPEPGEGGNESSPMGNPAPDFSLPVLGGEEVELFDIRGKVGILCFWTSWSASSIRRVNELIELVKDFPEGEVKLVAINSGESVTAIQRAVTKQGWVENLEIAIDRDLEVGKSYEARVYPKTVILDRKGNLSRFVGIGEVTRAMIEEAMGTEASDE